LASGAWQAPHLLKVSWSFTGKPATSGLSAGVVTFTSGLEAVFCESAGMEREARRSGSAGIQQAHLKRTRSSIDSIPRQALFEKRVGKGLLSVGAHESIVEMFFDGEEKVGCGIC
jgi:hypothetical protein